MSEVDVSVAIRAQTREWCSRVFICLGESRYRTAVSHLTDGARKWAGDGAKRAEPEWLEEKQGEFWTIAPKSGHVRAVASTWV